MAWALLNEGGIQSQGHRVRLILFWPVTVTAFLIGLIEAIIHSNDRRDDEEM
jgi:hypothetical protein